jgi:hypothetical protein
LSTRATLALERPIRYPRPVRLLLDLNQYYKERSNLILRLFLCFIRPILDFYMFPTSKQLAKMVLLWFSGYIKRRHGSYVARWLDVAQAWSK